MAIPVKCPHCQSKIKAPDNVAGKKVKCPKCGGAFKVPASTSGGGASKKPGSPRKKKGGGSDTNWYVQTSEGDEYGPVSRDDLSDWVTEGRARC